MMQVLMKGRTILLLYEKMIPQDEAERNAKQYDAKRIVRHVNFDDHFLSKLE